MKKILVSLLVTVSIVCTAAAQEKINIQNGEVNIAYNVSGNSDTALVLVHGWCINKEYWKPQEDYFSKRFKVVALDLGGHGQSGHNRNSWTTNDFANDVIAVINSLNLDKVVLVGHSMGGDIILKVYDSIPRRIVGLIGIDNFKDVRTEFKPEDKEPIEKFMQQMRTNFRYTATMYSRGALFPPNYQDTVSVNRVLDDIQSADSVVAYQALKASFESFLKEPQMLSQLKLPLHLIQSDYVPTNEAALKKYCAAGYAIKTIRGTGHYPMIEKPAEFNKALGETLNAIGEKK